MSETRYLSKSWVFKDRFFFKVRQHGQKQLYLQNEVCWILHKMVGAPSFSQSYLCIQPPLQFPTKNPFFYFSQFSPPYSTLTWSQNHPYNPFRYISAIFHLPKIYPKKYFLPQPFSHFRLRKGSRELGSLVMTDTALISPFFHKVYTVITELTITDSLSFRLKKLVYCRK